MKKSIKKIITFTLAVVMLITVISPSNVYALSKKETKNIKTLTNQMGGFEFVTLVTGITNKKSFKKVKTIKLTNANKALAAGLSINTSKSKCFSYNDDTEACYLSDKALKTKSKAMFGKSLGITSLPKKMKSPIAYVFQKKVKKVNKAIKITTIHDIHADFAVRKTTIKQNKKKKNECTVTKKIFYGYWMENDGKKSNYTITYTVKKKAKTKYGYVITAMKIKAN